MESDNAAQFQEEALPGGQAEDGLSWSQSSAEGSLALLDGLPSRPSVLSHLMRGHWWRNAVSVQTQACMRERVWGRQSWVLFAGGAKQHIP